MTRSTHHQFSPQPVHSDSPCFPQPRRTIPRRLTDRWTSPGDEVSRRCDEPNIKSG